MTCPECDGKVRVADTVQTPGNEVYRRRECLACGYIFVTVESEVERDKIFKKVWNSNYRKSKKGEIENVL